MRTTLEIMRSAKSAVPAVSAAPSEQKNQALCMMADCLQAFSEEILKENALDVEEARGTVSDVMIDRLALTRARIDAMADGIRDVAKLPDPVGRVLERIERPNGLIIEKTAVPLGVIAIIYESRPNVTSDAAALALKSGNAGILRAGLPREAVQLVEDTSRESAMELMHGVGYIDLLIPRGGAGLIRSCTENAKVPCIQTGTGICHIYVDDSADQEMALNIIENAKTSRPSVCNAAEVLLVHRSVADEFLPKLAGRLVDERAAQGNIPVELHLDPQAAKVITGEKAGSADFDTEYLDYKMGVKVVDSVEEAIAHIAAHSTGHSEAIITETKAHADLFTRMVDSAAVYVNASTRFTDGGEFGLGCEMGISTQKLHARGPMGLRELTTYKYIIHGSGQIR